MKKAVVVSLVGAVVFLGSYRIALSHCEIPCGIYGDEMRIGMLLEDITTVEKSMKVIDDLTDEASGGAPNTNQMVRWVLNKEEHCNKIQKVVTQYFMTQRVKPAPEGNAAAQKKYLAQLTALHGMLISAMKAKQTTDLEHVETMRKLVHAFAEAYFSAEDLKHLREHHKE